MTYEIEDGFQMPAPDGRAPRGPSLHPLDLKAIAGIKSGLYANELEAAKSLTPKYKPKLWIGFDKEKRRDLIKSKRKHYAKMLARIAAN